MNVRYLLIRNIFFYGFAHKIWRVKKCGLNLGVKEGLDLVDDLEELNLSPKTLVEEEVLGSQYSLLYLKPLSIASLSKFEGPMRNKNAEGSAVVSLYNSVQSEALRDLGFVSPP